MPHHTRDNYIFHTAARLVDFLPSGLLLDHPLFQPGDPPSIRFDEFNKVRQQIRQLAQVSFCSLQALDNFVQFSVQWIRG